MVKGRMERQGCKEDEGGGRGGGDGGVERGVVEGMKRVERGVVEGMKKVERGVVEGVEGVKTEKGKVENTGRCRCAGKEKEKCGLGEGNEEQYQNT